MAAQNIYDDPEFLAGYSTLARQAQGLAGAAEWPVLREMLPAIDGARVVDLGCGFGWFTRWAAEQGAESVIGIDLSERMLERARAMGSSETVEYRRSDLDALALEPHSVDVVFSSLTFHYVEDLDRLCSTIADALVPGGSLVFSVEHPIYSAATTQRFETSENGDRIWPLDNYLVEGRRVTTWFVDGVEKQHRTIATDVTSLLRAGLVLDDIVEWGPTEAEVEEDPTLADDRHRPWFLLLRASRPAGAS